MAHWGMLLDLKRCAGCGACVVACQLTNNQKPGVSWIKLDAKEWGQEIGSSGRTYLPHACMHCEDAPCVAVCPTGASQQLEDGVVVIDYDACINCGSCMQACPYDARVISKGDTNYFDSEEQAPYEAYGIQRQNTVEKCIFCHERVSDGLKTACTMNCPAGARYFGDLDDPESDVSKRIAWGDAVRVDNTSFYYVPVNGMPESELPLVGTGTAEGSAEKSEESGGINPAVVAVGAAAVVAAGAGVGVALKKSKQKGNAEGSDL